MQCKLTLFRGNVAFSSTRWGGCFTCLRLHVQWQQSCECQTEPRIELEMLAFVLLASPLFPQREAERIAAGKASGIIIDCFILADSKRHGADTSLSRLPAHEKHPKTGTPRIKKIHFWTQNKQSSTKHAPPGLFSGFIFFTLFTADGAVASFFFFLEGFFGAFIFLAD